MIQVYDKRVRSILLVSYFSPSRGHAGGLRLLDLYRELRRLRPDIHISLLTVDHCHEDWGVEGLDGIFDEIVRLSLARFSSSFLDGAQFRADDFQLIDLQYHQSGALVKGARTRWPNAIIVFSPMESQLRAALGHFAGGLKGRFAKFREAVVRIWLAVQEVRYVRAADLVITVSEPDQATLRWIKPHGSVVCIPTGFSQVEFLDVTPNYELSTEPVVVFFAYFGSKSNREALVWYCREVHSRLAAMVDNYVLRVVGRGLDQELIDACTVAGVEFIGQVEYIRDGLRDAAVGIAPALGGAGVRGKIHHYAASGIACVASPLANEGLEYNDGISILLARDSIEFANACASLLQDGLLRARIGRRAREVCFTHYTWDSLTNRIEAAYKL